ncbi:MAG TPA: hypothetical protein VMR48_06255 [Gaiellaceae bacterium]|nr:hypothetical protein [Gaiellaceae bacterium]
MQKLLALTGLGTLAAALLAATAMAGGPPAPSFYVNGTLYRTVGTPTDFSKTGAPASTYDTIYQFFGAQPYNVATAAPGDPGFNGGRWQVVGLSFADYSAALAAHDANGSGDFDTTAEVEAALGDGSATSLGVVKSFECPVIPLH